MTENTCPKRPLRPLAPVDLEAVSALPLVQLFATGRSGSMLVHSFLDGHPELLHVPQPFKFYDFVADNPGLTAVPKPEIVRRFVASHGPLFDTRTSHLLGGRLGGAMDSYVLVDPRAFSNVVDALLGTSPFDHRRLFLALTLAYAHCVGQDVARARVVFQHVHHGDWLFPDALSERYNVRPVRDGAPAELLRADKLLISVREPFETYLATAAFTAKLGLSREAEVDTLETYLRLLVQDWQRIEPAEREYRARVVRLEDLRADALGAMRSCASFLGIDAESPTLASSTFYGLPWFGDRFSPVSNTPRQERPKGSVGWQDAAFLETLVRAAARRHGYPTTGETAWRRMWRLARLAMSFVAPPAALYGERGRSAVGYVRALRRVARRLPLALRGCPRTATPQGMGRTVVSFKGRTHARRPRGRDRRSFPQRSR